MFSNNNSLSINSQATKTSVLSTTLFYQTPNIIRFSITISKSAFGSTSFSSSVRSFYELIFLFRSLLALLFIFHISGNDMYEFNKIITRVYFVLLEHFLPFYNLCFTESLLKTLCLLSRFVQLVGVCLYTFRRVCFESRLWCEK